MYDALVHGNGRHRSLASALGDLGVQDLELLMQSVECVSIAVRERCLCHFILLYIHKYGCGCVAEVCRCVLCGHIVLASSL